MQIGMMSMMKTDIPLETDPSRDHRIKRFRAFFLSPDFLIGFPSGLIVGVLPATIPALVPNGFAFFVTVAAVSAGIAALVLTPMTMMLTAITPAMRALLQQIPEGVAGTLVPFAQVAGVAVAACVSSLLVAILTPLAGGTFPLVIWFAAGFPIGLFLWAVIGCLQVTRSLIEMHRLSEKADLAAARLQRAQTRRAS
jgi:MFS family permease